jgi:small subunit ribosomal protein S17
VSETENETTEETTEPTAEAEAPAEAVAETPEPAADEPTPTEEEAAESPEPAAAEADATPEPEAEAAPAAPAKPQRSRRHVPRSARRTRSKPKAEKPGERKPITRLPKPERERGRRQERRGVVVSSAMDKTIVVKVDVIKMHPRYKKVIRRSQKFHAHDEGNQANVGDVVRIVETRPLSKTKNWRLAEVVEVAK